MNAIVQQPAMTPEEIRARNELSWKLAAEYVASIGVASIDINRMDPDDHSNLLTETEERQADHAFDRARDAEGHR